LLQITVNILTERFRNQNQTDKFGKNTIRDPET
jgi:hypothetical protein